MLIYQRVVGFRIGYPLVICYIADIAIENGPFIVDLPNLKIVIFPQLFQLTRGYSSIHTV